MQPIMLKTLDAAKFNAKLTEPAPIAKEPPPTSKEAAPLTK